MLYQNSLNIYIYIYIYIIYIIDDTSGLVKIKTIKLDNIIKIVTISKNLLVIIFLHRYVIIDLNIIMDRLI
jgi:hypothetical protein